MIIAVGILLVLVIGSFGLVFWYSATGDLLQIRLKRYGRTIEAQPLAWLVVSNRSPWTIQLVGDMNPVSTAFCEYEQETPAGPKRWRDTFRSSSGGMLLSSGEQMSIRVLLPTNGIPVRVKLLGATENESRLGKRLRPIRLWLYKHELLSPLVKIPVPFELKGTNIVTKFVN